MTEGAGPLRVLVVDDEPAILRFLRAGLGSQGYVVLEAENRQKALDAVRGKRTDIVVLDLGLPDIDGLEVIRRIRDVGSAVPIIVLSSRSDEAAKVQALDFGADDYVTKPFGIEELLARIRAAQRHRLQRQGEKPIFRTGDLSVDLVRRVVDCARQGSEVLATRVRFAAAARGACREGVDAQHDLARSVGSASQCAVSAHLHQGASPKDRVRHRQAGVVSRRRLGWATAQRVRLMKIKDVIGPEQVEVGLRVSDKAQLLRELSHHAAAAVSMDQSVIHDALLARENLGSTGLGKGFALPHAKLGTLQGFLRALFVRLARPVEFAAIDGQPVDLIILLLTPANAGNQHLAMLATLSRPLRDAEFVQRLRRAPDTAAIYKLLASVSSTACC